MVQSTSPTARQLALLNILVPTDFSDGSRWALLRAARLPLDPKATIHVVHVVSESRFVPQAARSAAETALDEAVDLLKGALGKVGRADVTVRKRLESGRPFHGIGRAADTVNADLVVAGRRGVRGLRDVLLGSTADRIIRTAKQPVLLVAEAPKAEYRHLAVSVELSEPLAPMLRWALRVGDEAAIVGAMHAYEVPHRALLVRGGASDEEMRAFRNEAKAEARDLLVEELGRAENELEIQSGTFRPLLRAGDPRRVVPRWAADLGVDVMVVGTHARGPVAHALLGSVAGELIRLLPCDTLVVPPERSGDDVRS